RRRTGTAAGARRVPRDQQAVPQGRAGRGRVGGAGGERCLGDGQLGAIEMPSTQRRWRGHDVVFPWRDDRSVPVFADFGTQILCRNWPLRPVGKETPLPPRGRGWRPPDPGPGEPGEGRGHSGGAAPSPRPAPPFGGRGGKKENAKGKKVSLGPAAP